MESKRFPSDNGRTSSNSDIAGSYDKHRKQHYLRYGEQGTIPYIILKTEKENRHVTIQHITTKENNYG